MRFEPNINCELTLSDGRAVRTPVVEVKNLNSFKAVREAIEYELREQPRRWQQDGLEMGAGMKSTRGWDDQRRATFLQREKEDAHDYRYFPDPDLVPVTVDDAWIARAKARIPELPLAKRQRYQHDLGLAVKDADCPLQIAALEGVPVDAWIRIVLHKEAVRVLAANGRRTDGLPPPHLRRPPRLQPRRLPDPEGDP